MRYGRNCICRFLTCVHKSWKVFDISSTLVCCLWWRTLVSSSRVCSERPFFDWYAADVIVKDFHDALARNPNMAVAVAAIHALTSVVKNSSAQTMMGLEKELKDAASSLERCNPTAISLKAGCELFLRYTTRTSALESENFEDAKDRIIEVCLALIRLLLVICALTLLPPGLMSENVIYYGHLHHPAFSAMA